TCPPVPPESVPVCGHIRRPVADYIEAPEACPGSRVPLINGFNVKAPTPLWMKENLRRCGIRSSDAVGDGTNYVLLELGQPMHDFDKDCLEGGIGVRMAKGGETVVWPDGPNGTVSAHAWVSRTHQEAWAWDGHFGGNPPGGSPNPKPPRRNPFS
ncbi:phenylalanine--tRNA ligase subunit beta, partial [Escherichia coli]|nr:phenylalanine--tRNA ligase subunit beta [Escherichia coli]